MFEYINNYYGLDCKINQVILFGDNQERMIIEGVEGAHLKCWDCSANKFVTVHPTWKIQYTDEIDEVRPKNFKSKERYGKYLKSECSESFGEWLKGRRYV